MRKPIIAGTIGALGAIAVIVGLVIAQVWPFEETSPPQEIPGQVSETETNPNGTMSPAPDDILDVELSIGDSVVTEVTRNAASDDDSEAPDTGESPTAAGTTDQSENTDNLPARGPGEAPSVGISLEFEVRGADGNIKESGSAR